MMNFDGSHNIDFGIACPLNPVTAMTIKITFKVPDTNANQGLVSFGSDFRMLIGIYLSKIFFYTTAGNLTWVIDPFANNTGFHTLVVTYDGEEGSMWLDGLEYPFVNDGDGVDLSASSLRVGLYDVNHLNGYVSDLRIWNTRQLSGTECLAVDDVIDFDHHWTFEDAPDGSAPLWNGASVIDHANLGTGNRGTPSSVGMTISNPVKPVNVGATQGVVSASNSVFGYGRIKSVPSVIDSTIQQDSDNSADTTGLTDKSESIKAEQINTIWFGDSRTKGTPSNYTWINGLTRSVYNYGADACTSAGIINRLYNLFTLAGTINIDKVVIQAGIVDGNTLLHKIYSGDYFRDILWAVKFIRQNFPSAGIILGNVVNINSYGATFLGISLADMTALVTKYNSFLQNVCSVNSLTYVDINHILTVGGYLSASYDSGDGVHFNTAGYNQIVSAYNGVL